LQLLLKALKYLNKYLKYYKKPLLAGFLFIILANILNVLAPFIVRIAFDHTLDEIAFFQHLKHSGFAEDYKQTVLNHAIMFGGLIVLLTVFRGYFMYLMRQTVIVVSRKIEYDLKNEILLQSQLYRRFDVKIERGCEQGQNVSGACHHVFCEPGFYFYRGGLSYDCGQPIHDASGIAAFACFVDINLLCKQNNQPQE
jgi:hypothetical protein